MCREDFGRAVLHAMSEATVGIEKTGEKIVLAKGIEKVLWEWLIDAGYLSPEEHKQAIAEAV